jgi:lipid-binding SYLF domain-containing protein
MFRPFVSSLIAIGVLFASEARLAADTPERTLQSASESLASVQAIPARCIPAALLADAQGIAIIPGVIKAGFLVGARGGHGVVFSRNADGGWGGPVFIRIGGASFGLQAGVQSTDVILVFKTRKSLERVVGGRGKLTLGADAAIAAGPIGRQAAAATDGKLSAEVYSYSRSRGLFAGVSFDGAAILYDSDANQAFAQNQSPQVLALVDKLRGQIALASDPHAPVLQPLAPPPPPHEILRPAPPPAPKWPN